MTESQRHISGDVKISVELIAGMIEGEGGVNWSDSQNKTSKQTTFIIHGTLKKTVFATSFKSLNEIIQKIRHDPEAYLANVPQDFCSMIFHSNILSIKLHNFLIFFIICDDSITYFSMLIEKIVPIFKVNNVKRSLKNASK